MKYGLELTNKDGARVKAPYQWDNKRAAYDWARANYAAGWRVYVYIADTGEIVIKRVLRK